MLTDQPIELFCWECGSPLKWEEGEYGPSVFPCDFCLSIEFDKGVEFERKEQHDY
jgi:hypothetical protein